MAEARLRLADIQFWHLGEEPEGLQQCEEAAALLRLFEDKDHPLAKLLLAQTEAHSGRYASLEGTGDRLAQGMRGRLRAEPLLEEAARAMPDDARGWMWLADCRIRLSRNAHDVNQDLDAMYWWIEKANDAVERAMALRPNDTDVHNVAARCSMYTAYAHLDAGDERVYEALEEASARAEALTALGDTRGPVREAQVLGIKARALARDQRYEEAWTLMLDVISRFDQAILVDVRNKMPFRLAEVSRYWAARFYLEAAEEGLVLAPRDEALRLVNETIAMHRERLARGWTNESERAYLENDQALKRRLLELDVADGRSGPP